MSLLDELLGNDDSVPVVSELSDGVDKTVKVSFRWDFKTTTSLIEIRNSKKHVSKFKLVSNSILARRKLWEEIGKELKINISPSKLSCKYKDLKRDFLKYKEDPRTSCSGKVVWLYFTIFQDSLGDDLEAEPFGKLSVGGTNLEIIINDMEQKEQVEKKKGSQSKYI